jgi:hypothetical protein
VLPHADARVGRAEVDADRRPFALPRHLFFFSLPRRGRGGGGGGFARGVEETRGCGGGGRWWSRVSRGGETDAGEGGFIAGRGRAPARGRWF